MLGMALAYGWYDASPAPVLLLFGLALTLALICRMLGTAAWPALLVAVCLLGLWRYETSQPSPTPLLFESNGPARVTGAIVSDPETTSTRTRFILQPTHILRQARRGDWEQLPDDVRILIYAHPPEKLVQLRERPYFRYGDRGGLNRRPAATGANRAL